MDSGHDRFDKGYIGNIRFEFFTGLGSLRIEAWRNTRACRVFTYSKGIGRNIEFRADDCQWDRIIDPVSCSGFWKWEKRYDSRGYVGYNPSWSFNVMTDGEWYYSSGDGGYPDGFLPMLRALIMFASDVDGIRIEPAACFLSPFISEDA